MQLKLNSKYMYFESYQEIAFLIDYSHKYLAKSSKIKGFAWFSILKNSVDIKNELWYYNE